MKMRARRKNDIFSPALHAPSTPLARSTELDASTPVCTRTQSGARSESPAVSPVVPKTPEVSALVKQENSERDGTPERIEIEVDGDEAPSVMDEDEWTDRNFGASCAENNSEESCDESSDEDDEDEEYSEALDVPLNVDETLRLAEDWTRKYARQNGEDSEEEDEDDGTEEEMSGSEEDEEPFSYQESDSEDDVSTATEGEEEIKAREARKQEVFLQVPDRALPTDSDTEVGTEYTTTSSSETEEENSATEISTDSEFERDETTPKHEVPDIVIGETVQTKRTTLETPQRVQYNGKPTVELQLKPLVSSDFIVPSRPLPLINPNKGDYNLNKTQSTEGIASKLSLELKKKYLFGAQDSGCKVMKSGSTSILDTKFKSFVNQISEAQKLLNPAPEPSVTMQAFLQGADRIKTPLIPPLPLIPAPGVRKEKELVNVKEFPHVCTLGDDNKPHICSLDTTLLDDKADGNVTTTQEVKPDNSISKANDINVTDKPSDVPLKDKSETITKVCDNTTGDNDRVDDVVIEENEARPRSPVHETSIIVPDVDLKKSVFNEKTNNWEAIEKKPASSSEDEMDVEEIKSQEAQEEAEAAAESDSCTLSSDDVSTLSSYDENSKAVNKVHMSPPKLEIHNSKGELLLEENCNHTAEVVDLVQSNLIKNSADRMNTSMPDVCQVPLTKPSTPPDDKTGSKSVENLTSNNSFNAKIISVPSDETSGSILKQVSHTSELFAGPEVKSNGRDSPASPVSESITTGALTETELSDWAREEEPMSEILDDSDFKHINTKNITFRRHQKTKTPKKALNLRGVAAKIAKSEEFDEIPHVCGKSPTTPTHSHPYPLAPSTSLVLTNVDNIEFMDTGNEDSSTEEVEEVNRGYVQFVNANTDDDSELSTPLAPEPSVPYKLLEINHNDEDEHSHVTTTTTSDQVTVKSNNPMPELNDNLVSDNNTPDAKTNTISQVVTKSNHIVELNSTPPLVEAKNEAVIIAMTNAQAMADPTSQAYQDYVQRFQGRISPFSNARDSIDIRKSRKHSRSSMSEVVAKESLKEDEKENLPSPTGSKPSTSKKLEELSRERTKQKDLIHEMVMNKLIAEGKSPTDRKSKRSARGSFSPLGLSGAQNALNHPILNQNEHLRTCPITNNFKITPPLYEQTRANQNHNSRNKTSPDHISHNKTSLEQYCHNKTSPDQHNHKSSLISPDPVNSNDEITPTNERQGVFTSLDVYCTPMTSLRSVRARPVSIHSPPSLYSTPCPLPPSPYSLPDIPQALAGSQDDVFTTPRRPPRVKQDFQ
ncbi:hypothetical protein WDU94_000815, partial [Cyamophila willieti]